MIYFKGKNSPHREAIFQSFQRQTPFKEETAQNIENAFLKHSKNSFSDPKLYDAYHFFVQKHCTLPYP